MLGETVREARIRKGLTQAKLARLAGVSRRHLAALEKGANVSIAVLRKVAAVLELVEIQLGDLALRSGDAGKAGVNVPLLTDTIREARVEAMRAQAILARAEDLLGNRSDGPAIDARFPTLPARAAESPVGVPSLEMVAERPDWFELHTSGELRQGAPIDEERKETLVFPRELVDGEELVFRARGEGLREHGIEDGDLLVVELRPRGLAKGGSSDMGRARGYNPSREPATP